MSDKKQIKEDKPSVLAILIFIALVLFGLHWGANEVVGEVIITQCKEDDKDYLEIGCSCRKDQYKSGFVAENLAMHFITDNPEYRQKFRKVMYNAAFSCPTK